MRATSLRELKRAVVRGDPDDAPFRVWWRVGSDRAEREVPIGELKVRILRIVPGQKIAYVVDASYTEENAHRIVDLVRGSDILFIEVAFLDIHAPIAAKKKHLTAGAAGGLGRRAGVKKLVPFHFSPRYTGHEEELAREAADAFGRGSDCGPAQGTGR